MKTTIFLDPELVAELGRTAVLTGERRSTVLRMAIRAGLPLVAGRFQSPRLEGCFAGDYPLPDNRLELEAAMSKLTNGPGP